MKLPVSIGGRGLVLLAGLVLAGGPAMAQAPAEGAELRGSVVDASTGTELRGASVRIGGEVRVITNRDGRFQVEDLRPGSYPVEVAQLGYDTLRVDVQVGEERTVEFRLAPDPVILERVTALVDRFAERRNSIGTSVRFFDSDQLHSSDAFNILDFLYDRGSLRFVSCGNPMAMNPCALVRGRIAPVQVYVDGAAVVGGGALLAAYRPDEIYNLEVIGGGRAVRLYTNWFVETVARGRRLPPGYLF